MEYKIRDEAFISFRKFSDVKFGKSRFNEKFKKYYNEEFQTGFISKWYPIEPLMSWLEADANEMNVSYDDYLAEMNEYISALSVSRTKKVLHKFFGTKIILDKSPDFLMSNMNCGSINRVVNFKNFYRAEHIIPELLMKFQIPLQKGSINGILKVCGNSLEHFTVVQKSTFDHNGEKMSKLVFEVLYS